MASKVYPLRASEFERRRWQVAADGHGLSFNAWVRRALNSQAELDEALAREAERVEGRVEADRSSVAGEAGR